MSVSTTTGQKLPPHPAPDIKGEAARWRGLLRDMCKMLRTAASRSAVGC
jgi:hypothetical protein